jgi:hypothetical protein
MNRENENKNNSLIQMLSILQIVQYLHTHLKSSCTMKHTFNI